MYKDYVKYVQVHAWNNKSVSMLNIHESNMVVKGGGGRSHVA